jgi:hypothetical protein
LWAAAEQRPDVKNKRSLTSDVQWNRRECGPINRQASSEGLPVGFEDSDVIRTTENNQLFDWSYFEFSLESLILAQDERWRRA